MSLCPNSGNWRIQFYNYFCLPWNCCIIVPLPYRHFSHVGSFFLPLAICIKSLVTWQPCPEYRCLHMPSTSFGVSVFLWVWLMWSLHESITRWFYLGKQAFHTAATESCPPSREEARSVGWLTHRAMYKVEFFTVVFTSLGFKKIIQDKWLFWSWVSF